MLYSTLHYIIVQYSAVQYSTVQKYIKTLIYKPEELNQILRHQCLYLMRFGNLCSEIELTLVLRLTADMCLAVLLSKHVQSNTILDIFFYMEYSSWKIRCK